MLVGGRDHGWILQDGKALLFSDKEKALLFSDKEEAEKHANELNARSSDAQYIVRPWPVSQGKH